jgi:HlyD family secretion protein
MDNRKKKYLLPIVIIFIVLLVGGFLLYRWKSQNGSNKKFSTMKVERGEISTTVTATGTINPVVTVLVGSQVSGTIKALYADFNSRVKEGQIIAQIDPSIFDAQVEQARANVLNAQANVLNAQANLKSAQANLEKADVAVSDAKRNLDRNRPLVERKVIAQSAFDTAQTNYDSAVAQQEAAKAQLESAKSQVESTKAQVEQTKAALKMAETNLRYTTIRSPVHGVVISRNVDVGQTVAASLQAPTLFTIAKDLTQMQVDTNVSEADVGNVAVGQDAAFTVDAYPEKKFRGKVSEIRNAPTTISNVVTYDVVIQVDNRDLKLKPGMTANVSVLVAHREGVLKISNAALRFRPEFVKSGEAENKRKGDLSKGPQLSGSGKSSQGEEKLTGRVWVLSPEGKPKPITIVLGITNGSFSEVVSGGLKEGTEVIVEEGSNKKSSSQGGSRGPSMRGFR